MNAVNAQPLRLVDSGLPGRMGPQSISGTIFTFLIRGFPQGVSILINASQEEIDVLTSSILDLIQEGKSIDLRQPVSNRGIFIPGFLSKETMFIHEKV